MIEICTPIPLPADFHENDHRFQLKSINDFILGDHHRSERGWGSVGKAGKVAATPRPAAEAELLTGDRSRVRGAIITNMDREAVHLSRAEAIRDIAAILERVEQGAQVIVERDHRPVAVIQPALQTGRRLSECVALADAHGSTVTLDEQFGKDLEEIIASHREPLDASRWD